MKAFPPLLQVIKICKSTKVSSFLTILNQNENSESKDKCPVPEDAITCYSQKYGHTHALPLLAMSPDSEE